MFYIDCSITPDGTINGFHLGLTVKEVNLVTELPRSRWYIQEVRDIILITIILKEMQFHYIFPRRYLLLVAAGWILILEKHDRCRGKSS